MSPTSTPVAIIGGGISGLACAYRLRQLGVPAILFEASDSIGGLIGTVEKDGFLFESGPQSFQGTETLLQLIKELGIETGLAESGSAGAALRSSPRKTAKNPDVAAGDAWQFPARRGIALENCIGASSPHETSQRRGIRGQFRATKIRPRNS